MIIRIARRGFGKYVVLNKKQMAVRCAPRKYEIKEAIAELRRQGNSLQSMKSMKITNPTMKA